MPNHVLQLDCTFNDGEVQRDLGSPYPELWIEFLVAFNSVYLASLLAQPFSAQLVTIQPEAGGNSQDTEIWQQGGTHAVWTSFPSPTGPGFYAPAVPVTDLQFYLVKLRVDAGTPNTATIWIDGVSLGVIDTTGNDMSDLGLLSLLANGVASPGGLVWFDLVKVGTSDGGADVFADAFEGDLSGWNSFVSASASIVVDPGIAPPGPPAPPVPVPRTCRPNTRARFLVTDLDTVPTTWLDNLSLGATCTYNLLQPATIDIPFRSNDPRVNTIFSDGDPLIAQSNRLIYAFFREGGSHPWVCRGAGIAMSPQDQADADVPVTHMVFYDPWQYLLGRPCFADTTGGLIGPDGLLFPATEMGHIAATLLKNTILSEGVGCFIDAGIAYGGTSFWAGTIETTPVVDYTVQQGSMVGDAWNQIVALEDPSGGTNLGGCDIVLTPIYDPVNRPGYTHELSIFNLAGDDLHASPLAWGEFVRSAITADRQHDGTPSQFVNVADFHVGQGGYPVPIGGPPPSNTASVALYRPYWESRFFPQQISAASVLALAQQELQLRKQGKRTFTVTPDPLRSGVPLRDYAIGDRIQLNMPAALRVKATGRQRIQTIPIDVNPDGMTRVAGLLTSPDWRGF